MVGGSPLVVKLKEPWFTLIKKGIKTVEGRPNKGIFKNIKVGDTIQFFNYKNSILVIVTDIVKYNTFRDMLEMEGLDKVLPDNSINNLDEGVAIYGKYYSPEIEKEYGVLAIKIKLVNN